MTGGITRSRAVASAFIRRDWQEATSYRFPFALDLFSTLFTVTLFYFLGRLFDPALNSSTRDLRGGFFTFALFGYVLFELGRTVLNAFPNRLRAEQVEGTLEALMATGTPTSALVLSSGAYQLAYATVRATVTVVLGLAAYGADVNATVLSFAAAVAATILGVLFFAAVGIIAAAFTMVFKQAQTITAMLGTALSLLAGVYYPIQVLPGAIRTIAEGVPLTWAIDVVRAGVIRGTVDELHLALLVPVGLLAIPLAMPVYLRSLRRAKREASLVEY